ncbi:death-on-curing family protein [methanogenic archaeon ISO4-H5]|nr:death-on-curing family protein [methanogenic archaeon ISO4-H5]
MRSQYPVEFFVNIHRIAVSINPSEADLAGLIRSESDLYFLGQKLESCTDKYERAANALYGIAYYHPFYEGNKRTALLTCELLLEDQIICAKEEEIYHFVLDVACGNADIESITEWLKNNTH